MEKEYHILVNGQSKVVSRSELELLKKQINENSEMKDNMSFDYDWYLSHGYVSVGSRDRLPDPLDNCHKI